MFQNLSLDLAEELLIGSVGAPHLLQAASTHAASPLGPELLLAAWEHEPLSGAISTQILDTHPLLADDAPLRTLLSGVKNAWKKPADMRYFDRLAQNKDFKKARHYLDRQFEREPNNLFWLQQIHAAAEILGDEPWLIEQLDKAETRFTNLAPLFAFLKANLAFGDKDYEKAIQGYENAATDLFLLPLERKAQALYHVGQTEKAIAIWKHLLQKRPWHTTLLLRVHDALLELGTRAVPVPEQTCVLLYTYNKSDSLNTTLKSLAQSRGWKFAMLIDNGSTDTTPDVLRAWQERLGDKLRVRTLPVNVGAPAARNWLMHDPDVANTYFAAYLDDDVILPPDWLEHLMVARKHYPEASVWGCRVMDHTLPRAIQSADIHLLLADASKEHSENTRAGNTSLAFAEPFQFSDLHNQVPDFGQFDYARPCLSVTGCCHLFNTASLLESGNFSLNLSPSQYDDVDHDLRQALNGGYACYYGFTQIQHLKQTGKMVRQNRAQYGNWLANRFKLYNSYSQNELLKLRSKQYELLKADMLQKARTVEDKLNIKLT